MFVFINVLVGGIVGGWVDAGDFEGGYLVVEALDLELYTD